LRRNYLLKHVIEGKIKGGIEMTGRQGRIVEVLLDKFRKRENTGNYKRKYQVAICR
jgi:hypothetical protein